MTVHHDLDHILADWFDATAPPVAPAGVRDAAMTSLGGTRQRPRWLAGLRSADAPDGGGALGSISVQLVGAAVVLALLLTVIAVTVGGRPTATTQLPALATTAPAPSVSGAPEQVAAFGMPFEVTPPTEGEWRRSGGSAPELITWQEGRWPAQRGITMASASTAWAHGCRDGQNAERFALDPAPDAFLAGLRDGAGVGLGEIEPTTLDGYSALVADIDPGENRCEFRDVHVKGPIAGLSVDGCCAGLEDPARIIAADIDGQPIFILIWAQTTDDLAAFLPMASEFVDSIRFQTAAPPTETAGFVAPFRFAIPAGSSLKPAAGHPASEIVAWTDGPDRPPQPDASGGTSSYRYGGQNPDSGDSHGIIVASTASAWVHRCRGERVAARSGPADFLADLRDVARVGIGAISATQLAGRPALTAAIDPQEPCLTPDVHVNGLISDLSHDFVMLGMPGQITAADISGHPIFVLVWARTQADLDAWMPEAEAFIDSMEFSAPP